MGVIERVSPNTPVTWCHRMNIVAKKDGSARRTIDLRPVNAATKKQTHIMESPFALAARVPPNSWRSTSDAWNGYHSVPLHPESCHLTTFLTPFGRLWYCVAPQGELVSGDTYTERYDLILEK